MRDISVLHPQLRKKSIELRKICEKNGLKIGIGECLRTVAEQDALYAKGRTQPGKRVTNARGSTYASQHQWGIAFDFYRNDGTGAYNETGDFFNRVGALAKTIGLGWGGDWKSPVDKPHLYLPDWGSTTTILKQQYGTPENFMKTWVKHPVFETDKTYIVTQACYLRSRAGAKVANRVRYDILSDAVKKKCGKKQEFAVFKKNKTFRLIKVRQMGGNVWGQMKSGYWVPLIYKDTKRVKAADKSKRTD